MKTGEAEEDVVLDSEQETDLEDDQPQGEEHDEEGEASEGAEETGDDDGGEEEETVVSIGSEEPPTSEDKEGDSPVLADLRKRYRETSRELQRLKAQQASGQQPATQAAPTLRKKPTLEEHEYDAEKYDADLDKWYAEKHAADKRAAEQEATRKAAQEAQAKAVQEIDAHYATTKAALKVKDYQEAEDEAAAALNVVQQSIVKAGAANPALLVYALGKNPKKLAELASIKDPVKFAVAVGKLETEVKVTKRPGSTKPAPERTPGGSNAGGATSKATLERLEAEAERTGDRSRVIAYKRQMKAAGKK